MSGRIVNRTTPGLRRPKPLHFPQWVHDEITKELAWYDQHAIATSLDSATGTKFVGQVNDEVSPYRFIEKALDTARQALRAEPKIVDYPGPGALDHYARGGVVRVSRTPDMAPVQRWWRETFG
ncbi:hypothetical protein [Rhodococcus sp. YH1]|uniref:hypothetical protein n=1 Tax=Rhodococcus sp. YH1 TaxID=89066 RepID=UPI001386B9C5|nr:hypothetical protein [Rhodococcus sp. YH1]